MIRPDRSARSLTWCVLAAATCCVAQQPATTPPAASAKPADTSAGQVTTLSLDARLVNLPVLVRDKKGVIVQNLTKDEFTLMVDGKPQTIRYFDKDASLPLTLGLLVDVSGSVSSTLDQERTASSSFLDGMLTAPEGRSADRAFLIQFSKSTELLQDMTSSRPKLQAAIKELGSTNPNAPPPDPNDNSNNGNSGNGNNGSGNNGNNGNNGNGRGNGGGSRRHGGTTLYDAVFLAAEDLMAKQKGRKAIVLLTDGEDNGSKESLNRCIEAAQRADMEVYAIYFKGEEHYDRDQSNNGGYPGGRNGGGYPGGGYPGGGGRWPGGGGGGQRPTETRLDGKKILDKMTTETGGRVFEESRKQDFASIYNQIAEELRSQYRLGFTPEKAIMEDGYHTVDLALPKKKDLRIQTRDGYYTGTE